MTRSGLSVLAVLLWIGTAHAAPACSDPAAAADARRQVESDCVCGLSPSRGAFLRCATDQLRARIEAELLPADCFPAVKRCLARSTCGRPDMVTCCRTTAAGVSKCSIKSSAATCRAPAGGSACVGVFASCCAACAEGGGCAVPTTTTSSTTTSTIAPTATEGCCVGDFEGQPVAVPPGTCAFEITGVPAMVAVYASTCADASATWSETRCTEPLCGPAAGCCANISSFAGASVGFFGDIPPDDGSGAAACVLIGGTPLEGPCP